MNLPFGVFTDNQPNLTLTLFLYGWLLCGLFSFAAFVLSIEERGAEGHDWKIKIKDDRHPCDCRKCTGKKITFGAIVIGFITIPAVIGMLMFMGPIGLIPIMADGHHKEAWAFVKRVDKKFNFLHLSALALPILALATLWWI